MQRTDEESNQDQISLIEIMRVMVRYKLIIIALPLLAAVGSYFVSSMMRSVWEATAIMRMGQVAFYSGAVMLETSTTAAERLKSRAAQDAVLATLGIPMQDRRAKLFRDSLRFRPFGGNDLLEIHVRGYSPDDASRIAEAAGKLLEQAHRNRFETAFIEQRKRITQFDNELLRLHDERKRLTPLARGDRLLSNRGADTPLFAYMAQHREDELSQLEDRLRRTKMDVEDMLSPVRTYPTSLLENPGVSDDPVSPRVVVNVVAGAAIGLFVGIGLAFFLNALHRSKSKDQGPLSV